MSFIRDVRKNVYLYLLALPGILFLFIFSYIPMSGHLIAFKNFKTAQGIWGSPWSGLDNFKFFFHSEDWYKVTFNTIYLNLLFLVFGLGTAVVVAILLNEIKQLAFKKIAQSLIFMPYFISWMVVSFIVFALLNTTEGMVNRTLIQLGFSSVSWYSSPQYWPVILTITSVWKSAGYNSIIILAAIAGLSGEYYESAKIDGASRLQQIFFITLPLIRPTIMVLALLAIGKIFYGDFGMIYGIVGDNTSLLPTTDVIDTYSFRSLRQIGNFGMASAVVLYQSVMGLITVIAFNALAKQVEDGSQLF